LTIQSHPSKFFILSFQKAVSVIYSIGPYTKKVPPDTLHLLDSSVESDLVMNLAPMSDEIVAKTAVDFGIE
jgi:hypothetical protein